MSDTVRLEEMTEKVRGSKFYLKDSIGTVEIQIN
jgi:hypothetical protein